MPIDAAPLRPAAEAILPDSGEGNAIAGDGCLTDAGAIAADDRRRFEGTERLIHPVVLVG